LYPGKPSKTVIPCYEPFHKRAFSVFFNTGCNLENLQDYDSDHVLTP
jgi:hypothetical protein